MNRVPIGGEQCKLFTMLKSLFYPSITSRNLFPFTRLGPR